MTYKKRYDGRDWKETRPITAKAGVIKNADGSGYFKIGKTEAWAGVYGPRNLHPRFMQDPTKGILRCHYSMMPFSGSGDRVRPGPSRRSKEISMVTEKALLPVLNLEAYPNTVVDIFIEMSNTDAGTRCAGICAASIALADAGLEMTDLVTAISIGKVDDKVVVDLDYAEEAHPEGDVADIPIAMIPSTGELTLLQMDGKVTKEELMTALKDVKQTFVDVAAVMREAVRAQFAQKE